MKKVKFYVAAVMLLVMLFTFSSYAAEYSKYGLTVTVPDSLKEDTKYAAANGYSNSWYNEAEDYFLDIYIDGNDDEYTYVDYTEKDFEKFFENYIKGSAYTITKNSAENVVINGFEGVKCDMNIELENNKSRHIIYAFSTNDTVYEFYFNDKDGKNLDLTEEIMKTVVIEGKPNDPEKENGVSSIIYIVVIAVISIGSFIARKLKAKKEGVNLDYQPVLDENGNPIKMTVNDIIPDQQPESAVEEKVVVPEKKEYVKPEWEE